MLAVVPVISDLVLHVNADQLLSSFFELIVGTLRIGSSMKWTVLSTSEGWGFDLLAFINCLRLKSCSLVKTHKLSVLLLGI